MNRRKILFIHWGDGLVDFTCVWADYEVDGKVRETKITKGFENELIQILSGKT